MGEDLFLRGMEEGLVPRGAGAGRRNAELRGTVRQNQLLLRLQPAPLPGLGRSRFGLVSVPALHHVGLVHVVHILGLVHVVHVGVLLRRSVLEVYLDVSVQVGLVAGPVLTHAADVRLLPGVDLGVPVQKGFPEEVLGAPGPAADVPVAVELLVVDPHVRLPVEGDAAAEVRGVEPLVHRHHVPLQVVPAVRDVAALRVAAVKRLVLAGLALRRGQVVQGRFMLRGD